MAVTHPAVGARLPGRAPPVGRAAALGRGLRRLAADVRRRRGLSVAVLGPDGAGKSTLTGHRGGVRPARPRRLHGAVAGRGRCPGTASPLAALAAARRPFRSWRRAAVTGWHQARGGSSCSTGTPTTRCSRPRRRTWRSSGCSSPCGAHRPGSVGGVDTRCARRDRRAGVRMRTRAHWPLCERVPFARPTAAAGRSARRGPLPRGPARRRHRPHLAGLPRPERRR